MSKEIRKQINKVKDWKHSLNEGTNSATFYHNSDYDFENFLVQKKDDKLKRNYLFFSNEKNTFIDRKYTYTVQLKFNSDKIFNCFKHINNFGLKYTLNEYENDIKKMFAKNLNYFYNAWLKAGVDSPDEVLEYFINEDGDGNDKIELLFYFLTKWNDSWVIIETDMFLTYIETKGFTGFVTQEEGLLNLALKDDFNAVIIKKEEMWPMLNERVNEKKPTDIFGHKLNVLLDMIDNQVDNPKQFIKNKIK